MKSKVILPIVAISVGTLILGCPKKPVIKAPGITPVPEKEKVEKEKVLVEVVDFKMEKIEKSLYGPEYGAIKISGTAIYHGTGKYDEVVAFLVFNLYDNNGNVVKRFEVPNFVCGEYRRPENIVPGKPFPFEYQDDEIKIDKWKVITEARFEKVTKL